MNKVTINNAALYFSDCLEALKSMPDNSVDSIVTDPPYGLNFMGKKWDYDVPSEAIWSECLRVLKPGGHLLAFAGTRTQHRMAVRIEDAGFEIRDMIAWVYGSGFPKSHDVSKAIDKAAGVEREVVGEYDTRGLQESSKNGRGSTGITGQQNVHFHQGCDSKIVNITAPATQAAQQWQGWGTALKPALEPLTVARKPLIGTVADNVLAHGTGGINVDGCRVATDDILSFGNRGLGDGVKFGKCTPTTEGVQNLQGRWPANFIHDGSEEVLAMFPEIKSVAKKPYINKSVASDCVASFSSGMEGKLRNYTRAADEGSAARFFYSAKASKRDRDEGLEGFEVKHAAGLPMRSANGEREGEGLDGSKTDRTTQRANIHPTVKPTDLMRYLCRLVTPPNGVVLDPFMGSGSTGKAAILEGFKFIGIEREAAYFDIAKARISFVGNQPVQQTLFGENNAT